MKTIRNAIFAFCLIVVLSAILVPTASAAIYVWEATAAFNDSYGQYGDGHAFWLPDLPSTEVKFIFNNDGIFKEYTDDSNNFTKALLTGTISAVGDPLNKWEVHVEFIATSPTGFPKKELISSAYVENSGPVDTDLWRYYNMDATNSYLLGLSDNSGDELNLIQYPFNNLMPLQVGYGANGKNTGFGASSWFYHTGDYEGRGDINIDLERVTNPVPEPATCMLLFSGLAGMALRKKKFSIN